MATMREWHTYWKSNIVARENPLTLSPQSRGEGTRGLTPRDSPSEACRSARVKK